MSDIKDCQINKIWQESYCFKQVCILNLKLISLLVFFFIKFILLLSSITLLTHMAQPHKVQMYVRPAPESSTSALDLDNYLLLFLPLAKVAFVPSQWCEGGLS